VAGRPCSIATMRSHGCSAAGSVRRPLPRPHRPQRQRAGNRGRQRQHPGAGGFVAERAERRAGEEGERQRTFCPLRWHAPNCARTTQYLGRAGPSSLSPGRQVYDELAYDASPPIRRGQICNDMKQLRSLDGGPPRPLPADQHAPAGRGWRVAPEPAPWHR
jgi:hypothetical protein